MQAQGQLRGDDASAGRSSVVAHIQTAASCVYKGGSVGGPQKRTGSPLGQGQDPPLNLRASDFSRCPTSCDTTTGGTTAARHVTSAVCSGWFTHIMR